MELWIGLIIGLLVGAIAAALIVRSIMRPKIDALVAATEAEVAEKRLTAEREAESILRVSREEAQELRIEAEKAIERRYQDLARAEERVDRRSDNQDSQAKKLELREQVLNKRQSKIDKRQNELADLESVHREKLEEIAAMTTDEARAVLLQQVEHEAQQDLARLMREIDSRAKETAEAQARKIIALAIQRLASDQVAEMVVSTVPIPSDEMKGRIIGRNGRNIRAFEQAAGVDIIVDDTPESVTVSSFDPVRREVARRALAKLITDGRIHPARIEKLISDAAEEVEHDIKEAGEEAAYEANVHGLHPEILKTLGRLKYRTSYGQNQLQHAVEASHIAAMLAAELGANIETAKMGALLHDLGKAMTTTRKAPTPRSARSSPSASRFRRWSLTPSPPTITRSNRTLLRPSSSRPPTPSPVRAPAHGARAWRTTSSASARWRRSPHLSPASRALTPCKPGARSASSSSPTRSTTWRPCVCPRRSPRTSRTACSTPGRFR